jgi:hypothetical protein
MELLGEGQSGNIGNNGKSETVRSASVFVVLIDLFYEENFGKERHYLSSFAP